MKIENAWYLLIDLEATCCDEGTVPRDEMEIIEIGAVLQNARTFEIEAEFQTFVRPVRHPVLTRFCRELTGIRQDDVDPAPSFGEAMNRLNAWRMSFDYALFGSWGNYDRKQFEKDCRFHGLSYPFGPGHLNVKDEFSKAVNTRRKHGIGSALRYLGMTFDGSPHRGLDDARNIARIVRRVCLGPADRS